MLKNKFHEMACQFTKTEKGLIFDFIQYSRAYYRLDSKSLKQSLLSTKVIYHASKTNIDLVIVSDQLFSDDKNNSVLKKTFVIFKKNNVIAVIETVPHHLKIKGDHFNISFLIKSISVKELAMALEIILPKELASEFFSVRDSLIESLSGRPTDNFIKMYSNGSIPFYKK